jgi:hypothetical protein
MYIYVDICNYILMEKGIDIWMDIIHWDNIYVLSRHCHELSYSYLSANFVWITINFILIKDVSFANMRR